MPDPLDEYQATWERALETLLASWDDISAQWRDAILTAMEGAPTVDDMTRILNGVIDTSSAEHIVTVAMQAVGELAAVQVAEEAHANGVQAMPIVLPLADMMASARMILRGMSMEYTLSAIREGFRNRGRFTPLDDIVQAARKRLDTLTQARPTQSFGALLTSAQHAARVATMAGAGGGAVGSPDGPFDSRGGIEYWEATERLDTNTCKPCRGIDGKRLYTLAEVDRYYPVAGFLGCDGGTRCRGTVVAHWYGEGAAPAAREDAMRRTMIAPHPALARAETLRRRERSRPYSIVIPDPTEDTPKPPADVYLYAEIGGWGVSAEEFVRDFTAIRADAVTVHINSPGGEVFDGIAIYQAIKDHPARVTTRVTGLAASAASFILQAGDERVVTEHAQVMIHNAMGVAVGNAADMREVADMLDKASANIAAIYAGASGRPAEDFQAAMDAETWYSAAEAVAAGLADRVGDVAPDEESDDDAATARWDLSVFAHRGRADAPAPSTPKTPSTFQLDVEAFKQALLGAERRPRPEKE